ncbi:MAG: tRNA 2-thiouridine(34) synthase MnmA [Dehalococcoidia bacterium]|nr:MAG: tRNA 2-thiouridine(34) synthase MnmA [Dehalococcoidia bacterium]
MNKGRVVVAMSGGVDSSMTAVLLKEAGYEVIGATMQIWPGETSDEDRFGGCCGLEAIEAATRVAHKLGIPHYVIDLRDIFAQKVIADFCQEYSLGRTPNPCVICNKYIKFGALLQKAGEMGADFMATGHYAQIEYTPSGYRLLKATDRSKDQSYFLYTLGQSELQQLLFPLGNRHKTEIKKEAARLGLPTRAESQDICFIPDNDLGAFIAAHVPLEPGDIVDTEGNILGKHTGLAQFTVGQRQGLGLASNKRLYVLRLDASSTRLIVGSKEQLLGKALLAGNLSWVSGEVPPEGAKISAKIRYQSPEVAAELYFNNGTAEVRFQQPQSAITPGQAVVGYQGEAVLGGGTIIEKLEGERVAQDFPDTVFCRGRNT